MLLCADRARVFNLSKVFLDGMEHFSRYLGINGTWTLSLCLIFRILLPAEGNIITEVAGRKVTLRCNSNNNSISKLRQLKWTMNGDHLFSFSPSAGLYNTSQAINLNLYMSTLEREWYALIIEKAQVNHTGNYTCETTSEAGVDQQTWQLIITEKSEKNEDLMIAVAVGVPCICFLVFLFIFIPREIRRRRAENNASPPVVEMSTQQPERSEDIYENCLENQARRAYLKTVAR